MKYTDEYNTSWTRVFGTPEWLRNIFEILVIIKSRSYRNGTLTVHVAYDVTIFGYIISSDILGNTYTMSDDGVIRKL